MTELDELFEELWSVEYRNTGDRAGAKEWARQILSRHTELIATELEKSFSAETGRYVREVIA